MNDVQKQEIQVPANLDGWARGMMSQANQMSAGANEACNAYNQIVNALAEEKKKNEALEAKLKKLEKGADPKE